ncbi:MAG: hypothetical protein CMJ58_07655 [Planctomycetaceae bacterium]|nr:hypothetical protein [Planctomycetaceae bacterium]
MATSSGSKSFGLRELATVLFRHKKKVLAFSLASLALGVLVLLFAPRKYRSEARLFLQVGRESVRLDPTATTGATIGLQQSGRDYEINSAMEVLKSRAVIQKTLERIGNDPDLQSDAPDINKGAAVVLGNLAVPGGGEGRSDGSNALAKAVMTPLHSAIEAVRSIDEISDQERAIIAIERNLKAEAEYESTVISVTYDADSPQLAQYVLDALLEVFREEHTRLHSTTGSKDFFASQRDELQQRVDGTMVAIRDAKNRMGLASIESRRNTLENRVSTIQLARVSAMQELQSAQAQIDRLEDQIAAMPEWMPTTKSVGPNTGADTLRSQLYALQVNVMNLEAKYNEDHPLVQSARDQVDEAKRLLAEERDERSTTVDAVNPNRRELVLSLAQTERSRAGLEARVAEIEKQEAEVMAMLQQLNGYEAELDELERQHEIAKSNLIRYEQNFEQARIDEELDRQRITNVNVAQQPTLAQKPVSPSKLIVLGLSLMLASVGSLALGLGAEKIDTRIWSQEHVERGLDLPVVAVLPESRAYGTIPRGP